MGSTCNLIVTATDIVDNNRVNSVMSFRSELLPKRISRSVNGELVRRMCVPSVLD